MYLHDLLKLRIEDVCSPLCESSIRHYERSLRRYGAHLGHLATVDDLEPRRLMRWAHSIVADGLAPYTAAQHLKQLRALWQWAYDGGLVGDRPPRRLVYVPERVTPDEWSGDQLSRLFRACERQTGWIGPHKASDWWLAFHWWTYNTGCRSGETWQVTVDMVDLQHGVASVPASIRKDARVAMRWWLSSDCAAVMEPMLRRSDDLVFARHWRDKTAFHERYRRLLSDAGLPKHRRNGPHKIRRTVATRIKIRGGDPSVWLGHSPRTVADSHYVDRWAVQTALRNVWPTNRLDDDATPPGQQRQLFVA